jgi:predicted RNase H-like HicB family nuclease
MQSLSLTAIFMKVPEGYLGFIEELPEANTQGDTIEKARENLKEAVALVMESNRALAEQAMEGSEVVGACEAVLAAFCGPPVRLLAAPA